MSRRTSNTSGSGKWRSSRSAEPLSNEIFEPAGMVTPWYSTSRATQRDWVGDGASKRISSSTALAMQRRIVDQQLPLVGEPLERDHAEPEQPGHRLGAGRRDQLHERDDLLERERAGRAVVLDLRVHQPGEEVVLRVLAPHLHELGDHGERLVVDLAALVDDLAVLLTVRRGRALVDVQALVGRAP